MKKINLAIAGILSLFAVGAATAQQFNNVPGRSVIGRLGLPGDTGPAQAIPFATLQAQLGAGVFGPGPGTVVNDFVLWNNTTGTLLKDANSATVWGLLGVTPCANMPVLTGAVTSAGATCTTAINYTTSLTGGAARTLNSKLGDWIEAKDFGVVCDGVTDDRQALQQAVNSTPMGGTLHISAQNTTAGCMVSKGGGSYAILITQPIHIVCDIGVAISPTAAVNSVSSVLYFQGNVLGFTFPTIIEGCLIGNLGVATRNGLHGIVFDTLAAGVAFRAPIVRNVYIQAGTTGNGYGIAAFNNVTNNPGGGTYGAIFGDGSIIQGGIYLSGVGDSITIRDAIIPQNTAVGADNNGIYILIANGAGGAGGDTVLRNLNFSQSKGVKVDCAYNLLIDSGEYELQAALTGSALVDINAGGCSPLNSVKVRNAQFQANSGIGTPLLLRIAAGVGHTIIDGNAFATPSSYTAVSNASTALQLVPNFWSTSATHISGTAPANTYGGG
jgi:hypothetical protein